MLDQIRNTREGLHPTWKLISTLPILPLLALIGDIFSLIIKRLIPKLKHKGDKERGLLHLLLEAIVRIFNSIRKTVRFGLSYWFPEKKVKYNIMRSYHPGDADNKKYKITIFCREVIIVETPIFYGDFDGMFSFIIGLFDDVEGEEKKDSTHVFFAKKMSEKDIDYIQSTLKLMLSSHGITS